MVTNISCVIQVDVGFREDFIKFIKFWHLLLGIDFHIIEKPQNEQFS